MGAQLSTLEISKSTSAVDDMGSDGSNSGAFSLFLPTICISVDKVGETAEMYPSSTAKKVAMYGKKPTAQCTSWGLVNAHTE